jgi:hypothetical protein
VIYRLKIPFSLKKQRIMTLNESYVYYDIYFYVFDKNPY